MPFGKAGAGSIPFCECGFFAAMGHQSMATMYSPVYPFELRWLSDRAGGMALGVCLLNSSLQMLLTTWHCFYLFY